MTDRSRCPEYVVLTIFPTMFPGPLGFGVVGKALARGTIALAVQDLREFADPPHYQVDDAPFGGGAGMVLKPEPLFRALTRLRAAAPDRRTRVVLLDPAGRRFDQPCARELAAEDRIVFVCGRYEGIDERIREHLVDDVISVGDYVVSGGELPAMTLIDAVSRLVPGVVGEPESLVHESFEPAPSPAGSELAGAAPARLPVRLDHPHYTRPAQFEGWAVPEVLLSGNHAQIAAWRQRAALERTQRQRPDLLEETRGTAAHQRDNTGDETTEPTRHAAG